MEDYGDVCREIPVESNLLMHVEMNSLKSEQRGRRISQAERKDNGHGLGSEIKFSLYK